MLCSGENVYVGEGGCRGAAEVYIYYKGGWKMKEM
jgi:hypothetical protein